MSEATVIVRFDEAGDISYHVSGQAVRLYIVDERAPGDRVYEWTLRDTAEEVQSILGASPVGSSADERHASIEHKIKAHVEGRPRLTAVKPGVK